MSVKRTTSTKSDKVFKPQGSKAVNYCFTLNNYTEEEVFEIDTLVTNPDSNIRFICYGFEKGEDGTPHLQGYLELHKEGIKKLSFWMKIQKPKMKISARAKFLGVRCRPVLPGTSRLFL